MSLRTSPGWADNGDHRTAAEFGIVTAILVAVYLWYRVVRDVLPMVFANGLPIEGLVGVSLFSGGIFIVGLTSFAVAYGRYRGLQSGLTRPTRSDLPLVGIAATAPIVLVGLTKLAGVVTGVTYNSLTLTSVAADPPLGPILAVLVVSLVVSVPALVIVCQVLVQGSFRQTVDGPTAVVLTALVTGFVMLSNTGGLVVAPDIGKLVGTVLFTLLLVVGLLVRDHTTRDSLRALALVPVLLFLLLVVVSGIAGLETMAGVLFVGTHVSVLGIAAYTYERTDSILPPAIAYTSLLVANRTVVVVLEAGMHNW